MSVADSASSESTPPVGAAPPSRRRRRFGWGALDIQSKLLVMLCATTIVSSGVVGFIAYKSGTSALQDSANARLVETRNSRAADFTRAIDTLQKNMIVYTRGQTVLQATQEFTAGFAELNANPVTEQDKTKVETHYDSVFVPWLNDNLGSSSTAAGFLPTSNAQWYLQARYTTPFNNFDDAIKLDDAGDGSAWSAAHAKYQAYFRTLTEQFGYDDVQLIDTTGNVVYSAYAGVDLGTNLNSGPYRGSGIAAAYTAAINSNDLDHIGFADLDRYQPSGGVPTGWVVSPIGEGGSVVGVLAVALPLASINKIMTGNNNWAADGLGSTGETFLVGPDHLMRSTSRLVAEDPQEYERRAVAAGTAPEVAARAARVKGTVLIQPISSVAIVDALQGRTGEVVITDYLGGQSLTAYAPVKVGDLTWAIEARISADEVFAPVTDLARNIILSTLAIIFVVCLASLLLAQVFARPLRRLLGGVQAVAGGSLGAQVDVRTTDEFGALGSAFNEMSRSLETKQQLLDEQLAENRRLLLTMMPESVADRYARGDETIAEDHQAVTVIYADMIGWDEFTAGLPSEQGLALLNGVLRSIDEIASRLGVERIRTVRNGYLASCGLTVPRVDHTRRVVDLAIELERIVGRFNAANGASIRVRAGIDTGTVSSGLVGGNAAYDLWGDAVNLAFRVRTTGGHPGVFVTDRVATALQERYRFADAGELQTDDGTARVWTLDTAAP